MTDTARFQRDVAGPYFDGFTITPNDDEDLPRLARGIYVGGGNGESPGDVKIVTPAGSTLTFKNVPVGSTLPWVAKRVMNTGTTATNLIGGV
jgi:hypothetical protein